MRMTKIIGTALALVLLAVLFLSTGPAGASETKRSGSKGSAAKDPLSRFTPEQVKKLKAGEAIYETVREKGEGGVTRGYGRSTAIVEAPIDKAFETFTRFDEQEEYFPRKTESKVVKHWDHKYLVHKVFEFYVVDIEYHVIYSVDEKNHRVDFEMSKDHPHDIDDTAGYFQFKKIDEETTLFTYAATKVETGLKVPGFIQGYISSKDLPDVVLNVKKRIESGGKWKKKD